MSRLKALSGQNFDRQRIPIWRKRASRKMRERARRMICAIEIEYDRAIGRKRSIQKASSAIC
jgi:hypothetical protein